MITTRSCMDSSMNCHWYVTRKELLPSTTWPKSTRVRFLGSLLTSFLSMNRNCACTRPSRARARSTAVSECGGVPQSSQFHWRLSPKSRREKPRYIIVAFQTGKSGDQTQNAPVFDHCRLRNIYVTLNADRYPAIDFNASFTQNKISRVYKNVADFRKNYFNMDRLISNCNINPSDFVDLYPLFVIDVSHQSERLKESVVDIQIRAEFERNVPANTEAFALVISDRILQFESDGQKMNVVF